MVGGGGGGLGEVAWEGEGRWEGRGWCLRRERCNIQRDSACRVGQAASMIDKVLGGAIIVNHHLLFPFKRLKDFLTTTSLESSLGSMGEIASSSTSGVHRH